MESSRGYKISEVGEVNNINMQPKNKSILMNKRRHQIESPMDYEKKVQQSRAETLAFLKSLKIEEAKADLKEALRAIKGPCLKTFSKRTYERVPRSLRPRKEINYNEKDLKAKLKEPRRKNKKKARSVKLLTDSEFDRIYKSALQSLRPENRLDYTEKDLKSPYIKDNKKEPLTKLGDSEFTIMSQLCKVLERSAETGVSLDDLPSQLKSRRLPPKPDNVQKRYTKPNEGQHLNSTQLGIRHPKFGRTKNKRVFCREPCFVKDGLKGRKKQDEKKKDSF